jgi:hypothetical protein
VLQLFGMGIGLVAIDLTSSGSLRSVGIGTTVWSIIAPLIALFVGGFAAAKFAHTYDRRSGAGHGVVTWALASILGVLALGSIASTLAHGVAGLSVTMPSDDIAIDPSARARALQQATDQIGRILLGVGVSMLLALGAAIMGGLAGAQHTMRPRPRTTDEPEVPPEQPPTEAPNVAS